MTRGRATTAPVDSAHAALAGLTAWDALAALLRASYFGYVDKDRQRRRKLPDVAVEFATTLLALRTTPAAMNQQAPSLLSEVVEPVRAGVLSAKIAQQARLPGSDAGRMLRDALFWEFSPGPEEEVLQRATNAYAPHDDTFRHHLGFGVDDGQRLCATLRGKLRAFLLDTPSLVVGRDGRVAIGDEPTFIETGVERRLTLTVRRLSMLAGVELEATEAFVSHLSLGFGCRVLDLVPSISRVRDHPLLRYGDTTALASPTALPTALGALYEGALRATGQTEVAKALRGATSEIDAHAALCAALRPDRAWRNVRCIAASQSFERDLLIVIDTVALAIEVKGVSVRTGRSGTDTAANAIVRRNLVEAAAQARSFAAFLLEHGSPMDALTRTGDRQAIAAADYSRVIPVVVTLEDLTTISPTLVELRGDGDRLPIWPLSLTDIAWYSEMLCLPSRFVHYGLWRLRVSSHADVLHDETEWLAKYVADGPAAMLESVDRAKRAPPNLNLRLFDSSVQRGQIPGYVAAQRLPYEGLLEALDATRLPGWLEASLAILDLNPAEWELLTEATVRAMAPSALTRDQVSVESRVAVANAETVVHMIGAPYSTRSRREWQRASSQAVASATELTTAVVNHVVLFPRDRRAQSFDAIHVRLANGRWCNLEWTTTAHGRTPARNDLCSCGSGRKYKKCCGR